MVHKITLFISAALLLLVSGCTKEAEQQHSRQLTSVGVSLETLHTRTFLDPNDSDIRQVYWSEGDVVNINGSRSLPLGTGQAGKTVADFSCYSGKSPFSVIYPASVCVDRKYSENGTMTIEIPLNQEYSPTSFGKGAAILYGYGEQTPVALQNLCGAIRVTVKDASAKIRKAVLISNGNVDPVAGTFSLNPRTGECTAISGAYSIGLDITEDISLGAEGSSFYFTVPKGDYIAGFTFRFYAEDGGVMECRWLDNKDLTDESGLVIEGGKLYQFKPVDYTEGGLMILSAEDWVYIAEQINAGSDGWKKRYLNSSTNALKLGADIILPDNTPVIDEFAAILDGCGHTVTRQMKVVPLVKTLKGAIKNLTVAGDVTECGKLAEYGAVPFVYDLQGGTLENCTNKLNMSITSGSADAVFAGFVNTSEGGTIRNCVNEGNISLTANAASSTSPVVYGGGILASAGVLSSQLLITGSRNKGTIYLKAEFGADAAAPGLKNVAVGGIVGKVNSGDADKYVKVSGCDNENQLKLDCSATDVAKSATYQYSLGGIIGQAAVVLDNGKLANPVTAGGSFYVLLENCTNKSALYNNSISRCGSADIDGKVFTGGVVGSIFGLASKHAELKNCTNTGDVVPYIGGFTRQAFPAVCGGLVGVGGYVDIKGGKVTASIGTSEAFSYAQGGIIGTALTKFSISGVDVSADILMAESKTYTIGNYALAVTSSDKISSGWKALTGSVIETCRFKGSLAITTGSYSSSKLTVPPAGSAVMVSDSDFKDYLVGKSYTGPDMAVSDDNQYLN